MRRFLATSCVLLLKATAALAGDGPRLDFVSQEKLYLPDSEVKEPSGLDVQDKPGYFWTVSDETAALIALQDAPLRAQNAAFLDFAGMEGVARGWDHGVVLMVHEESNSIVWLDLKTNDGPRSVTISDLDGFGDVAKHFAGNERNKGLEGIAVDRAGRRVFVVKEGQPRVLLEISSDLSRIVDHTVLKQEFGFQVKGLKDQKLDISGLFYDPRRDSLWMASDRGECVFLFDLSSGTARRLEIFPREGKFPDLEGIEGIALSHDSTMLYLVSDVGKHSSFITLSVSGK